MIANVVAEARAAFDAGVTRPLDWRRAQLKSIIRMLDEHSDDFEAALSSDLGRSPQESFLLDVALTVSEVKLMIKNLARWTTPRKVPTKAVSRPGSSKRVPQPLGVVLVIAPWNYPVQLLLVPVAGAIAAGNAVVLKPSEVSAATSALLGKLVPMYLDSKAISIVEGSVETATELLEQKFDHIFFTGGTSVGRLVMQAAAKHLTPVTLELGGKSPTIVDASANVKVAARRIAWGKFINAGQTCVAPDYVLAHRSIVDELVAEIGNSVTDFFGSDPQQSRDYSRIVSDRHFDRLAAMLASGTAAVGGVADAESRYIAPTVLVDVDCTTTIMNEEIFGPLLPVISVDSMQQAIEFVNNRPHPLALYVFAEDSTVSDQVVADTTSGGVTVNGTIMHITSPHLPFGGIGESGTGAYHGQASVDLFQHLKPVLTRTTKIDPSIAYPPYTKRKLKILRRVL